MSGITLPTPLFPLLLDPHSLHVTMMTHKVPPTLKELHQKLLSSPQPPCRLNHSQEGCLTWWTRLTNGSRCIYARREHAPSGRGSLELFTVVVWYMTWITLKSYILPDGRPQPSGYLLPSWKGLDGWKPLIAWVHYITGTSYPKADSPGMRDFHVTMKEETLVLAWALQWYTEGLGVHGTSKGACPPNVAGWRWDHGGFTVGPCWKQAHNAPAMEEEAVFLGEGPEPQKALEVTMSSPEHPKTPELEEPTEGSDNQSPPVPLPTASSSQGNCFQKTVRARHRARAQCLPNPNPEHANEWVQTYLNECSKLPDWWQELRSLHHKGTGSLSNPQVQELVRKQVAAFRLPVAQKEKHSWWSTLPSLTILRRGDFLPDLPTRIQGPRDICVVRRDETVGLAPALQWCTIQLGTPQEYSEMLSKICAGVLCLSWKGVTS